MNGGLHYSTFEEYEDQLSIAKAMSGIFSNSKEKPHYPNLSRLDHGWTGKFERFLATNFRKSLFFLQVKYQIWA